MKFIRKYRDGINYFKVRVCYVIYGSKAVDNAVIIDSILLKKADNQLVQHPQKK